jgi:UDP-N-acetylmuramoylalanine--D-glutamate ligase
MKSIALKGKKVSIIGAKRSGQAAAAIVKKRGGIPFVSDSDPQIEGETRKIISDLEIQAEFGRHSDRIYDCDLMIISPGVDANSQIVKTAFSRKIAVWPEIELAYHLCQGKIIGITGSNGKTTTTALIGALFDAAGIPAFVCGNIGNPFVGVAESIPVDGYAVVELSSFQLEMIDHFLPDIAIILNITPDHLDRHGNLQNYIDSKWKIFKNQTPQNFAILNHDDGILREKSKSLKSQINFFSTQTKMGDGVWAEIDGHIHIGGMKLMPSIEIKIKGEHNLSNACASIAAAAICNIPNESIITALKSFPGVEHRLEPVRLIGGVSFINDSKGTNVDSVFWALKAISTPIILIAGGKDKAGDFSVLNELVSQKVKDVIAIGQAAPKIKATWTGIAPIVDADTLEKAVMIAYELSKPGDTVLLSPGCASFDMFNNYEHRGQVFKKAVLALEPRQ